MTPTLVGFCDGVDWTVLLQFPPQTNTRVGDRDLSRETIKTFSG